MQNQDTGDTENQENLESTESTEGGSSNSDEVIEPTEPNMDTGSETTDDTIDLFKEEEKQVSRNARQEALIEKQLDNLLETSDEDEREEILSKYPSLRKEVENQYSEIIGEEKIDYTAIQEENARLKEQLAGNTKVSEVQEANAVLNNTLKDLGMKTSEFKENYQEEFLQEMAVFQKAGLSKKDSISKTFQLLGLTKSVKEAEERRKAQVNATIPQKGSGGKDGFTMIKSEDFDLLSSKEQDKYIANCTKTKGALDFL
ncbi:MAG: hypothetical protein U9R15_04810 [Chloroflexota bacterium]|nr:hypothetical protein [Chloroflexota bacterium]